MVGPVDECHHVQMGYIAIPFDDDGLTLIQSISINFKEHSGNREYRNLVAKRADDFRYAKDHAGRERVVHDIIETIRAHGGRFLRKLDKAECLALNAVSCGPMKDQTSHCLYAEVEDDNVVKKTKQAFRYCYRSCGGENRHQTPVHVTSFLEHHQASSVALQPSHPSLRSRECKPQKLEPSADGVKASTSSAVNPMGIRLSSIPNSQSVLTESQQLDHVKQQGKGVSQRRQSLDHTRAPLKKRRMMTDHDESRYTEDARKQLLVDRPALQHSTMGLVGLKNHFNDDFPSQNKQDLKFAHSYHLDPSQAIAARHGPYHEAKNGLVSPNPELGLILQATCQQVPGSFLQFGTNKTTNQATPLSPTRPSDGPNTAYKAWLPENSPADALYPILPLQDSLRSLLEERASRSAVLDERANHRLQSMIGLLTQGSTSVADSLSALSPRSLSSDTRNDQLELILRSLQDHSLRQQGEMYLPETVVSRDRVGLAMLLASSSDRRDLHGTAGIPLYSSVGDRRRSADLINLLLLSASHLSQESFRSW